MTWLHWLACTRQNRGHFSRFLYSAAGMQQYWTLFLCSASYSVTRSFWQLLFSSLYSSLHCCRSNIVPFCDRFCYRAMGLYHPARSMVLYHAPWTSVVSCTMVLYHGVVPWCCTMVLYHGVVPWCCTMVSYHGVVPVRALYQLISHHNNPL